MLNFNHEFLSFHPRRFCSVKKIALFLLFLLLSFTLACGGGPSRSGVASWYGPGFAGRPTASGEPFNPKELTAAHKTLPFGTRVKVTNKANGRSVVVRINDRFPGTKGRVIDLSAEAFERIADPRVGLTEVELEVLD
jgi:rare lipoprotein A